jgi:hypothetical protein
MEVYENDEVYSNFDKLRRVFPEDDAWVIEYFSCGIASDGSKFANIIKKITPSIAGAAIGGVTGGIVGGISGGLTGGVIGGAIGNVTGEVFRETATVLIDRLINKGEKIPQDKIRREFADFDYSGYHSLSETIYKYFDSIKKGNEIGMKYDKQGAIDYFNLALHYALEIKKKSNGLINDDWINTTILADVYSRLGSIYTYIADFPRANENFYEADELLKACGANNGDINFLDRRIEITGYDMGNSMRNIKEIDRFLGSRKFKDIEKNFSEKKIDEFIRKLPERNSFASYFDKKLVNLAQEYSTQKSNYFYSNIYVYDKMRYLVAIGKFLATRACYDFIEFGKDRNKIKAKEDVEKRIHKGLNLIIEGYDVSIIRNIIYRDNLIEEYIASEACYNLYIQKTLARNFTILLGLGYFSSDEQLIDKYTQLLIKLDKKERNRNCRASYDIMWGSVQTAIEKVLKPYNVNIPPYDKLKEQIK